ncbi:undecaprenyl-phosphate glucose phosphotransferase [Hahella ganghwensis]|uniref:undecaprenyl-phosphate glucose phosphotransferase n=1 Tax=Hahella ganghwensis TaxID=286420 RepID=UPI0003733A7F|nr:undecaprenyl-phosphate glucose phosphotransferase [Hahella ganghwensis]
MYNTGLVRPYHSLITLFQHFADVFIILLSLWLGCKGMGVTFDTQYSQLGLLASLLYFLFATHQDIYESWRGQSIRDEILLVGRVWFEVLLVLLAVGFALKSTEYFSRKALAFWATLSPLLLIGLRASVRGVLRKMRSVGRNSRSIVIAGAGVLGLELAKLIGESPWMGMNIKGFYDDKLDLGTKPIHNLDLEVIGPLKQLPVDIHHYRYDEVFIALPMQAENSVKELVSKLADSTIQVQYVPDIFTFNLINSRIRHIGGFPIISVYDSPLDTVGRIIKRGEDIFIGGLILALIFIPMLIIAFLIKCTSRGPVFFKQRRYGLNGEEIWVWKFRTMSVCEDGYVIHQVKKDDCRITRLGSVLRKCSLDELPQFINVIKGSMSIVGPRPHAVAHNELYRKEIEGYMQRHMIKPGITGWAQINGWRGETDTLDKMTKRVEHDMHYIRNWSIWLDIKIILLTLIKGFINRNAY